MLSIVCTVLNIAFFIIMGDGAAIESEFVFNGERLHDFNILLTRM